MCWSTTPGTPEQLAQLYDVNVLSTQRVNRAVLPHLRRQKQGLVVWVSSSSAAGGTPPYLAPYFAAKAGMDAMAVIYARELTRWGIETSIIVPGAFTGDTNHFARSGRPADEARVAEYEAGPNKGLGEKILEAFGAIVPPDADASAVAEAIVKVVGAPFGKRPFRVHRPHSGWSRCYLCCHGPGPRRNAASTRPRRSARSSKGLCRIVVMRRWPSERDVATATSRSRHFCSR